MKKIAIATMTGGANYGNALQNYAVRKLIEQCGYEAETLRITTKNGYPDTDRQDLPLTSKLRPAYIRSYLRNRQSAVCGAKNDEDFSFSRLKELKENADIWRNASKRKHERFSAFQNSMLKYTDFEVSNLDFNLPELEKYSAFVTGSDQVWNPHYRTNSMVEFLQMVPQEKRIAFAPSFGISEIPECRRKDYAKWLNEIPYLSVREVEGARIVKELTGRDAKILLDPTFGLTKEEWLSFAKCPENCTLHTGAYVLCYFLGNRTREYTEYIRQYAEQHECTVIDVYDATCLEHYTYSPQEFVWLLANANAVFTDSFHGCAFSINLKKTFVVFDRSGDGCITQSSRITTVLGKTGLEDRKFEKLSTDKIDSICFENAAQAIRKERDDMMTYLRSSLNAVTSCSQK